MKFTDISLYDGICLHVMQTDRFKTDYLSVNFYYPLREGEAAYSSLLPNVMRCGTVSYPDLAALNRRYDLLYSSQIDPFRVRKGDIECIGFSCNMLRDAFVPDGTDIRDGVLKLLYEILFCPVTENGAFCRAYVENEKRVLTESIRSQINNKIHYAVSRCIEEMCRDELYGQPVTGTEQEVAAITPEGLYHFYLQVLRTARIEIYFIGDGDTASLADSLRDLFSALPGKRLTLPATQITRRAEHPPGEITESQPVSQGKLSIGFRTGHALSDDDYYVFSVFCAVFSSSPVSKLFMNVREKHSLCYYCTAVPDPHKGIMVVTAGIRNENKEKTQTEIFRQLQAIRDGDITNEEMQSALQALRSAYRELQDNPASAENWFVNRLLARRSETPDDVERLVLSVTKEDVARIARDITPDTVFFMEGTSDGEEDGSEEEDDA